MENVELMEGLEILSVKDGSIPILVSIFLGALCFIVIVLSAYIVIGAIKDGSFGGAMIGLLFLGFGVFFNCMVIEETIKPTPIYKVLVSDSVSMNEFYSKYEILNVDGKIYTIEPKGE
jgi:hypothetical protein